MKEHVLVPLAGTVHGPWGKSNSVRVIRKLRSERSR